MGERKRKSHITFKILAVVLILVLPLNIFSIVSAIRLMGEVREQTELGVRNITDVYANTLELNIQKTDLYLFEMVTGNKESIILKKQDNNHTYKNALYRCYRELDDQLAKETMVDGYFYYMERSGDCLLTVTSELRDEQDHLEQFITSAAPEDNRWHLKTIHKREYLFKMAREKEFYYGALIAMDDLAREIEDNIHYTSARVSFALEPGTVSEAVQVYSECTRAGMVIQTRLESSEVDGTISVWNKLLILGAFILLLVIPIMYFYLGKVVIRPLTKLNQAHLEMEQGNRAYRITVAADSAEFQHAYDSYNRMMNNIEHLRLENVEKELEKKQLELNNLQLQIRPHFLLNTFNLMYMLCSRNAIDSIRELILYLADYFRYIFRSENELELFEKELKLIEGYIAAAKIRYPDALSIMYQIEPEIRLVRIPPLLIHNFVENVVNHALAYGTVVHIVLAAHYEDETITFQISDDGAGMSAEQVDKINHGRWEQDSDGSHLGIRNAALRLNYFYGAAASLRVTSEEGTGTTFTISFPYRLEEV